jgi:hypothetical protein
MTVSRAPAPSSSFPPRHPDGTSAGPIFHTVAKFGFGSCAGRLVTRAVGRVISRSRLFPNRHNRKGQAPSAAGAVNALGAERRGGRTCKMPYLVLRTEPVIDTRDARLATLAAHATWGQGPACNAIRADTGRITPSGFVESSAGRDGRSDPTLFFVTAYRALRLAIGQCALRCVALPAQRDDLFAGC